jgi:DNA-binding NarL/FixJ family response regulator
MEKTRVAIFEDNPHLRDALTLLIDGSESYRVVGAYPDAGFLLERIQATKPQVVLMDIQMPGMNGIEAVRLIRTVFPDLPVVMQTVFEDEDKIFAALCAGATGYLIKNASPDRMLAAIADAASGGAPLTPTIARKAIAFFHRFGPLTEKTDYQLTARELDVLQLLVQGLPYKLISDRLGIGYETVRTHMKHIYEKLKVTSSTEAVAKALKENLV